MTEIRPLGGPAAWTGADLRRDEAGWRRPLAPAHVAEVERAMDHVRRKGLAWHEVTREDFPLDGLAVELAAVAEELENGRGVVQLKGLPVDRYRADELKALYFGLARHLGTPMYQSYDGELMGEIRDEGPDVGLVHGQMTEADGSAFLSSRSRSQSDGPLRWHTDRTDVIGLLCAGAPAEGGTSRLASAIAIHDAMVRRRPDLAALLYEPIWRNMLGDEADGAERVFGMPVFNVKDGRFASYYSRTYVEAAQKLAGTPKMTAAQWQALDMLAELGDELCFGMDLEPGDLQLINDHVVYHGRTGYRDDPASGPGAPPLPGLDLHAQRPRAARKFRRAVRRDAGRASARRHPPGRRRGHPHAVRLRHAR